MADSEINALPAASSVTSGDRIPVDQYDDGWVTKYCTAAQLLGSVPIEVLTETEYEALDPPDENTLYIVLPD